MQRCGSFVLVEDTHGKGRSRISRHFAKSNRYLHCASKRLESHPANPLAALSERSEGDRAALVGMRTLYTLLAMSVRGPSETCQQPVATSAAQGRPQVTAWPPKRRS
jgi:hypothetical protein